MSAITAIGGPNTMRGENFLQSGQGITSGRTYWVDSVTGSNSNSGRLTAPVASIQYAAASLCRSGYWDTIYALPGHVETISAAASLAFSKAGINVIGIGEGNARPLFNFTTATTADIDIDAANITIQNCRFDLTSVDAVAAPIDVNAAGFSLLDCEFEVADAGGQAAMVLTADGAADNLRFKRNVVYGSSDAGFTTALTLGALTNAWIEDNLFHIYATTTLGAINNTAAAFNIQVHRNRINNLTASSAVCMTFHASTTGQASQNYMQVLTGTAPIVGAAMSWVGANYYAATIATAGTLI